MGTLGPVTALARPNIEGDDIFLDVEPLFWHARINGTAFAYTNNRNTIGLPTKGDTQEVRFGWDFGVRVGAGYSFDYDGWDLLLNYLHYSTTEQENVFTNIMGILMPQKGTTLIGVGVREARSQMSVFVDSIDILLGREYFISPYVAIKPAFGFKSSWFDIKQKTSYTGGAFLDVNSYYVTDKSYFWGIGPKIGAGTEWFLGSGFSLSTTLAAALQYGHFDVSYFQQQSNTANQDLRIRENRHQFAPEIEFGLGLGYGTYLNNHCNYLDVSLWYEGEYWFRQNQTINVLQANAARYINHSEDVSFHGATLKVRVNF